MYIQALIGNSQTEVGLPTKWAWPRHDRPVIIIVQLILEVDEINVFRTILSATDLQECEVEISVVVGDKRSILVMNGEVSDERMDVSTATISPRHPGTCPVCKEWGLGSDGFWAELVTYARLSAGLQQINKPENTDNS